MAAIDNAPRGDGLNIEWGETTYADEEAEFMHTKGRDVADIYDEKAKEPSTIKEALLFRAKKQVLFIGGYADAVKEKLDNWKTATPDEVDQAVSKTLEEDPHWTKDVEEQASIFEKVIGLFDSADLTNVQLAIIKKKEGNDETDYAYLVLYAPKEKDGQRKMEVSFPTALCHVIDATVLLRSSNPVEDSGIMYDVSLNKTAPMPDDELKLIVTNVGRTPLDKIIQGGLRVSDTIRNIKGQHIDPVAAYTNKDYAIQYALATHRGAGEVSNEKIVLPPLKF